MEDILYNILWIDDEHESLISTKGRAKSNGINLIGYKSLNSGMSELKRNIHFYDGIILDAKFYENDDDIAGSEDTENVHRAKEMLLQLSKKFEIFVYTGQAEAFEDRTFNKAFKKVYKKGSSDERDMLFNDIKIAADSQEDTQIRHEYKRVFEVCTEKYIGEFAGRDILSLLKVNDDFHIDNHFNAIRKIVEDLFIAFNKFRLLPLEFVTPTVALNQSSIFLSGQDQNENTDLIYKQYRHLKETHLPKQVVSSLRGILSVTQDGSHRSMIDLHVKTINTNYLFKSVLFQLLDVITWFKQHIDSKPKIENWELVEILETVEHSNSNKIMDGKVIEKENLSRKGKDFAFFKPSILESNVLIPSHLVSSHFLQDEMEIKVEIEEYIDNRTGENKTRVKRILNQ